MQQIIYVYRFRFEECNGFQDTWSFSVPGGWDDPKGLDLKCMLRWSAGYLWLEVEISTIYKIFDQLVNIWKRGRRMETIPKHLPPRILPVFNIHLFHVSLTGPENVSQLVAYSAVDIILTDVADAQYSYEYSYNSCYCCTYHCRTYSRMYL